MYGIYTYIWLIFMVNVVNIPYMDPMGMYLFQKRRSKPFQGKTKTRKDLKSWTERQDMEKLRLKLEEVKGFSLPGKKPSDVWENSRKLQELKIET